MQLDNCFYCTKTGKIHDYMIAVCEVNSYNLYLFKDQKHRGRVVVATNEHFDEPFELDESARNSFWQTTLAISKTVKDVFKADKINYAIYGDLMSHVHFHIVPKYKDGLQWGVPFTDDIEKEYLSENEYKSIIDKIQQSLKERNVIK